MSKLHIRFLPSQLYLEAFSDTFHACSALLVQYPVVTDEKSSSSIFTKAIYSGLIKFGPASRCFAVLLSSYICLTVTSGLLFWYKIIKEVGDGTFGTVWRAINKQSGEVVAIKKMKRKYYSWEECINLREVKSLRKMNHPNIVKLKEVIRENDILYFVFEYMECNLYQLIKDRAKLFSEAEVRNWCFQVFQGLAYMRQRGYFHRDLKPVTAKFCCYAVCWNPKYDLSGIGPLKFCFSLHYTILQLICGQWVQSWPNCLPSVPFFQAQEEVKSEADEIYKICSVLGTPTASVWAEGLKLANDINYQFPQLTGVHLSVLIPSASEDAVNFITSLCSWDPCKRPTALEALQHPFFQSCFYIPPSLRSKSAVTRTPPSGVQRKLELNNQDAIKNDKFTKAAAKPQPRYRPPARNSPTSIYNGKVARGVSETAEKLGNMALGSARVPARHAVPAPMKAGGWHGQPHLFLGRSQEIQPGRSLSRKVAG
ncbi:hypothetical protein RHGRI_020584 [Rhododendron griersonianum]|uniref:Protein kinase domain-containing protein n=1 Tax=Rhododendron griersonianum TaxID=479676 RepID=A0AAV6JI66_9ERIC|nr:hypothetical protein RHGRI_020584 [Rhododendron griersonianum]